MQTSPGKKHGCPPDVRSYSVSSSNGYVCVDTGDSGTGKEYVVARLIHKQSFPYSERLLWRLIVAPFRKTLPRLNFSVI
jgi:hypothetical protein